MQLVVFRVSMPHGIRGEVTVQVRTDDPGRRFAAGSVLATEPDDRGPLTEVASPEDPDEFNDHALLGLQVLTTAGALVGTVRDVLHHGQDLLVVQQAAGPPAEALVPFVTPIVPVVDIAAGRLIIDPPPGLLDPDTGR